MAVDTTSSLAKATEARRKIEILTDKAQDDLLRAISCFSIAADSTRSDYLIACGEEFLTLLRLKMNMVKALASGKELFSMPESDHDRSCGVQEGRGEGI
jgi:hypothetical protein